ncbi:DUF1566 domain-containing protein [Arcobacter venerupis]|uniref:DUF1566 domain-containing protein n=1 Tax=Arcobacter venerupis TaxID=1054033 RepID=A0AAE7B8P1_9BACT|nr:DUF1566 domain-containing protein [Arcobacter venerupis]QKF65852.1 DUF1566 domain-containing protein [Arcobacter venerupis]RWS50355.1 hypothetical protein CKA56_05330 [Arcobacter venerupis]
MKYLLLVLVFLSLLDARIYRDNTKQVVLDDVTKLMWIDDISVIKNLMDHYEAEEYCNNLSFLNFSDWRLADIDEFETIVFKKNVRTNVNSAFKYNVPDGYWASTAHWRTLWYNADYMHFVSGTPYYDNRKTKKYVRCVRNY